VDCDVDIVQQYLATQWEGKPKLGGELAVGGGGIDAEVREQVELWVLEQGQDRTQRCVHSHTDGYSVTAAV